jgi:hypothetical protein
MGYYYDMYYGFDDDDEERKRKAISKKRDSLINELLGIEEPVVEVTEEFIEVEKGLLNKIKNYFK